MTNYVTYTISTVGQLNAAIAAMDVGGASAAADTDYTILLTTDLGAGANLTAINLVAGDALTINGDSGNTENNPTSVIDGGGHRGFVVESGSVTLENLSLINFRATGGAGGAGASAGGGGAGLGGAVFVGAGNDVIISNVSFSGDSAHGGAGGKVTGTGVGAGGSGEPNGFGAGGPGGAAAGFGGGGGSGAAGGFGGGSGAGGGLGAGGDIFVQSGGGLTILSGTVGAGSVAGGTAGTGGSAGGAFGGGLFIQGNTTVTLASGTVTGVVADEGGSGGAGAGALDITGAVTLSGTNTYTGGVAIAAGAALTLTNSKGAGAGAIRFGGAGVLSLASGVAPANVIDGFTDSSGATIDLQGLGAPVSDHLGAGNTLTVTGAGGALTLKLDPTRNYGSDTFYLSRDGAGVNVNAIQTRFVVKSEADLNAALQAIDLGGASSRTNTAYKIVFANGFTLGGDLDAINLASGDKLTIDGGGATMDGGHAYRGFFVYAGNVALDNLTIANTVATGGAGGAFTGNGYGGGGGLGGAGGAGSGQYAGGGGGVGSGATGGARGAGGAGILLGAGGGSGGSGQGAGGGGAFGGGGGSGGIHSGSGRDPRSFPNPSGSGGDASGGNFGGGAGSGELAGFGGGGAASNGSAYGTAASGDGGWGGGAGGGVAGFGGGGGLGGGGLGAGGAIFVQQGGVITFAGGSVSGSTVAGGVGSTGAGSGSALGAGLFLQGNGQLRLSPLAGQTLVISDQIADESSGGGSGSAGLLVTGAGSVALQSTNLFTGGVTLSGGSLALLAAGAAGSGVISFAYGKASTLAIGAGDTPTNLIDGFLPGDVLDLKGIGTATKALLGAGDVLKITGGTTAITLNLDPAQTFTGETFKVTTDSAGGTLLTALTTGGDAPPHIYGAGVTIDGADNAHLRPLSGVTVRDLDAGATETVTVTLSSTANGGLANLGIGSYDAATGVYTVTGTTAAVTAALRAMTFVPVNHEVAPGSAVDTTFSITAGDGVMSDSGVDTVHIVAQNTAPTIKNVPATFEPAYFTVPMRPLAGIIVADPDVGATETVTISLGSNAFGTTGDSQGTLSLSSPVDGISLSETAPGSGVYTLTAGSPAAVSAALRALKFTPAYNASGFTITYVGVSVSDGTATTTASTSIESGAPVIAGTVAGQATSDTTAIDPFASVKITDSPEFTSDTVTITLTDSGGAATDADGTLSGAGLTKAGTGIYQLAAATPARLTSEIDALVFTPTTHQVAAGATVTTGFTISVFNGATTSDNGDTTVVATGTAAARAHLMAQAAASLGGQGAAASSPIALAHSRQPMLAIARHA
jgi:hypothetical protein